MMLTTVKKHSFKILCVLLPLIIVIFRIWYIRDCNTLCIRNDEYGYWSHAALFSGHDWSDVLAGHMNWYSYGYSLILTPLFWFSHNMRIMYRAAIILNGIFGILTFFICAKCARILFPKVHRGILLFASFMVCMYSSYIAQGPIAWSETFLYLMVWLLLYLFLRFEQHPDTGRAAALSLCMAGCYITHNRTIGIVTAYILIVLFLKFTNAVNWKIFAALFVPLFVVLFVNVNIKSYLCIMEGFGLKPKNGMGAQKDHLLSLLTLEGWWNLVRALSGQLWCLATSTFGMLFYGLARCCGQIYHALRTKQADRHTVFYMFTLLACLGTFLISAISLIDPASITNLDGDADLSYFIYSRYDECIIGILLLLGFLDFAAHKRDLGFMLPTLCGACLYAGMCVILYFNLQRITDTWHYRSFCAAGIGFYRLVSEKFSFGWCTFLGSMVFLLLFILLSIYRKRFYQVRIILSCILLAGIFIPTGLYSAKIGTINSQQGKSSCGNLDLYYQLKDVIGKEPVYCTLDDTSNFRIAYELQVNLIDTHVYSITLEDLPIHEEGYFICCSNGDLEKLKGNDYYMLDQSRSYTILAKGDALAAKTGQACGKLLTNLKALP